MRMRKNDGENRKCGVLCYFHAVVCGEEESVNGKNKG